MKKKTVKAEKIRVRIAPSPTGPLHIGTARSALFNYLFAKRNKGVFVLRIEDTDVQRSNLKWTEEIIDNLKWLGIDWQEGPDVDGQFGPYKQSQRLDIYEKYIKKLLDSKKAYHCFCSEEELEAIRQEQMARGVAPHYTGKCRNLSPEDQEKNLKHKKPSVIRLKVDAKKIKFDDLIRGKIEFDAGLLGDFIIAKDLKTPLYNLAVVIDDEEMKISHVIRGEDHISNTPKQILMQEALGFYQPTYAHLPLILAPDRTKLSKRHGAFAVSEYKEEGYLPEAIVNFMALLGWNPGRNQEIFTLSSLAKEFSIERVQKSGAIFNIQKLDSINSFYIKQKSTDKLTLLCLPYLISAKMIEKNGNNYKVTETGEGISLSTIQKIVESYKSRMKKLSEITELADFLFKSKLVYSKELLKWDDMSDEDVKNSLSASEKILSSAKSWNLKNLEKILIEEAIKFNLENNYPESNRGFLLWPLRSALSGKKASPSPFEIADILGKGKTLQRIKEAKELLK